MDRQEREQGGRGGIGLDRSGVAGVDRKGWRGADNNGKVCNGRMGKDSNGLLRSVEVLARTGRRGEAFIGTVGPGGHWRGRIGDAGLER